MTASADAPDAIALPRHVHVPVTDTRTELLTIVSGGDAIGAAVATGAGPWHRVVLKPARPRGHGHHAGHPRRRSSDRGTGSAANQVVEAEIVLTADFAGIPLYLRAQTEHLFITLAGTDGRHLHSVIWDVGEGDGLTLDLADLTDTTPGVYERSGFIWIYDAPVSEDCAELAEW